MDINNILTIVISFIAGGGLLKLISVISEKRKLDAQADMEETKVTKENIHNTSDIVEVYKKALDDFKKYYEQKEQLLLQNNTDLERKIQELTKKMAELQKSNTELQTKLESANQKITEFNKLINSIKQ